MKKNITLRRNCLQDFTHRAKRYFLKMLYGQEAVLTEIILYTIYDFNKLYHKAVENHFMNLIKCISKT